MRRPSVPSGARWRWCSRSPSPSGTGAACDYAIAVGWVQTAEGLCDELPDEYKTKRSAWLRALTGTEQGARALAGALVLDLCHIAAPESVTSAVANELVRGLPAQGFQIDADELLPWLYGTVRRPERRAGRRRLRPRCRRTPARNARPTA